jgi:hypothetical protein
MDQFDVTTTEGSAMEVTTPAGQAVAGIQELTGPDGDAFIGMPAFPILVRQIEVKMGAEKGFQKGHFRKEVMMAVRKHVTDEVDRQHKELGTQPFERELPFTLSLSAKEKFLVSISDKVSERGMVAAGSYFKPGRKVFGTVNEAFDALDEGAKQLEAEMDDNRSYAGEVVARWVWDPPPSTQGIMFPDEGTPGGT